MKKNRKNKTMLLALLVVAITSMTIVFAAMSTNLKIKGSGLVSTDAWNIKFENLASVTLKGTAQETTAPTIKSDTEIGDYVVVLKRTGDEVVYNFDIHNYGKLNAKIEELNIQTPVCTGNAEDEAQKVADAQTVSESLTYTLTYSDGTEVKIGDTLKAEEVKNLTLKLAYTGENMPSESVQITGLSVSIKYVQDTSTEEPVEPSIDPSEIAGKKFNEETRIILDGTPVTIPSGATVSAIEGEYESVDNGVVMYVIPEGEEVTDWNADEDENGIIDVQENYDQFVWVPVPNAVLDLSGDPSAVSTENEIRNSVQKEIDQGRYPMALKVNDKDYIGIIYQFSLSEDGTHVEIKPADKYNWCPLGEEKTAGIYYREPAYLADTTHADASKENYVGITEQSLKKDYREMVERVKETEGFWVGRYETCNVNEEKVTIRRKIIGLLRGIDWYISYDKQKKYSENVNMTLTSNMIWGSQWDQIMIWMRNVKNEQKNSYYIVNSLTMGNYGTKDETIDINRDKVSAVGRFDVKNIYDLAGNVEEWTMTSYGIQSRALRGGSYYDTSGTSCSSSDKNYVNSENGTFGTRIVLF